MTYSSNYFLNISSHLSRSMSVTPAQNIPHASDASTLPSNQLLNTPYGVTPKSTNTQANALSLLFYNPDNWNEPYNWDAFPTQALLDGPDGFSTGATATASQKTLFTNSSGMLTESVADTIDDIAHYPFGDVSTSWIAANLFEMGPINVLNTTTRQDFFIEDHFAPSNGFLSPSAPASRDEAPVHDPASGLLIDGLIHPVVSSLSSAAATLGSWLGKAPR